MDYKIEVIKKDAEVSTNLSLIKVQIEKDVEKASKINVSVDNIHEAKDIMASLNKVPVSVKNSLKDTLSELKKPYDLLRGEIKEIELICSEARGPIAEKVKSFEDGKRLEHTLAMREYAEKKLADLEVEGKFANIELPSPSISGLTKTGGLKKDTRDKIDLLASNALSEQKLDAAEKAKQRAEDEARANEIVAQREIEKAKEEGVDRKNDNYEASQKLTEQHQHREVEKDKSVYKITEVTIVTKSFFIKAKSGADVNIILEKTSGMNNFEEEETSSSRTCKEL